MVFITLTTLITLQREFAWLLSDTERPRARQQSQGVAHTLCASKVRFVREESQTCVGGKSDLCAESQTCVGGKLDLCG
jgi:hypothetical protein